MVRSSTTVLVIREAIPRDFLPVTNLLTAAFAGSSVACWINPEEGRRRLTVLAYIGGLVRRTISDGIAQVAKDGDEVVGAALWSLHSDTSSPVAVRPVSTVIDRALTDMHQRQRRLERLVVERRPIDVVCQQLVCVGVRPDRWGRGIGSSLLNGHHIFLRVTAIPSYVVAPDERLRDWFERYGYSGIGPPHLLPDSPPMQAMWRPPGADPI